MWNIPDSKASFIPVESFADVSKYVQLFCSAYLSASCRPTSRCSSWSILLPTLKCFYNYFKLSSTFSNCKKYRAIRKWKQSYSNHNLVFVIDMLLDSFEPMIQVMKCKVLITIKLIFNLKTSEETLLWNTYPSDIKNDQCCDCSSVILSCYCSKTFWSWCIPNLCWIEPFNITLLG